MAGRGPRLTLISLVAGAVALALGYVGYRSLPDDLSPGAALYRSIQLFFLDYQGPPTGIPWELEAARFIAAAVVLLAAVGVLAALAREHVQRLRVRAWLRPHVVVAGLGSRGTRIAKSLRDDGTKVVAVERTAGGGVPGARAAGIPVFVGDARSSAILNNARITSANRLVVVVGDDSTALEILAAAHRALTSGRSREALVQVAIEDLALWQQLHRLALVRDSDGVRVDFLSLPDRTAELLVSGAGSALPSPDGEDRIIVEGGGPTAARAVVHAVRRSLLAGNRASVMLRGAAGPSVQGELGRTAPWLGRAEMARVSVDGLGDEARPTVCLVGGLEEADALAAGVALATEFDSVAPVFVAVPDRDTADALAATELRFAALNLVPTEEQVLGPGLLDASAIEVIARAKHEDYVLHEHMRGIDEVANPSVVPWELLPESLQDSNRRFAESVGAKLAALGAALVPLAGPLPEGGLPIPASDLEDLARAEHDRWMTDLKEDGWRYHDEPKDPERKRHPLLVPWSELDESERQKDREAIQALPKALATVGYAIEVPARGGDADG